MYILTGKSCNLLGVFTTKNMLKAAIQAIRQSDVNQPLYFQKIQVDTFDSHLINFFSIHHEDLVSISELD